jgi:hypothetical protein
VRITYRAGSGGLFDRIRWRCSGTGYGCGVWMASAWDWAPAMAAEHVARNHPNSRPRGLSSQVPGPCSGLVDLLGAEL